MSSVTFLIVACRHFELRFVGRDVLHPRGQFPFAGLILVHDQTPDAGEKTRDAFHAFHAPRFHLLERAHEHFVAAKRVRAVLVDHVVGSMTLPQRFDIFCCLRRESFPD